MGRKTLPLLLVALLFACNLTNAQSVSSPDSALLSILSSLRGSPLSLADAVNHALQNATSVRKAEAALLAARGAERREAGIFDPELFFTLNHADQRAPTASFFAGASVLATKQTRSESGLRMRLPIGTELELSLNTTRLSTNSGFAFLNPEYDAFGNFTIRQPLLGGFAASARKRLTSAELQLSAEQARYDQQVLGIRTEVEQSYWDLYAAGRDYAVQQLSRDRAETFLRETELRARAGLVGPNQVANARTFLAEQELLTIERAEQLDRQSDLLSVLTGVHAPGDSLRFLAADEPPSEYPVDNMNAVVEHALKNNLDLQAMGQNVEAARTLAKAAGWEALPSVNLVGSVGGNGLGGTNQVVVFGTDTLRVSGGGSFGNAVRQVAQRDYPSWSVGVEVSIPIGLRSGLGEKERQEAEVLGFEQEYIAQTRTLEEQVRSAYREVSHGKSRIAAARAGVDAAQEQVRVGLIEFHNGRLTAFELTRLGEDFAVAQQRYSNALVRTAKAAAALRQLTSGWYQPSTR